MSDPAQLIAYPPIKWNIKLENLDEHREVASYEEENQKLQVNLIHFFCLI